VWKLWAFGHEKLGAITLKECPEEGKMIAITHYKKARAIYNLVGLESEAQRVESTISLAHNIVGKGEGGQSIMPVTSSVIQNMKNTYESKNTTLGISSESTTRSGLNYASALWNTENLIKAERLVAKLVAVSHRVHGPDHKISIDADKLLKQFK
jgi:hypothetical protein